MNKFINIGYGNIISADRIVAIINPDAAPVKRLIRELRETGRLVDATCGRKTRAAIFTDSDHVILAANQPETIASRLGSITEAREVPLNEQ